MDGRTDTKGDTKALKRGRGDQILKIQKNEFHPEIILGKPWITPLPINQEQKQIIQEKEKTT